MRGVLAVVVPFLNERHYLPRFLEQLDAQTEPADLLVLVDDGSTDGSDVVVRDFAEGRADVLSVRLPSKPPTSDRLATAAELKAFYAGLERVAQPWDIVAKLDADLSLPPDHFERIRAELRDDPRLGVTGAYLSMALTDGRVVREPHPEHHVRGPNKFYRRACFDQVFPIPAILGWDTIDEVKARMLGWDTRSVSLQVDPVHLRPTGTYDGALRGFARWGQCAWAIGDPPAAVAAGALTRMRRRPRVIGGLAYAFGWVRSGMRRDLRADAAVRAQVRHEQHARIAAALPHCVSVVLKMDPDRTTRQDDKRAELDNRT